MSQLDPVRLQKVQRELQNFPAVEQLPYKERRNRLANYNLERRLRLRLGVIKSVNKTNAELFSPNPQFGGGE